MNVKLISYTLHPDQLCTSIAKVCYKSNPRDEETFLKSILDSGHLSIIEHASFTFLIEGISRVASHQLVRHRIASYTQQSLRYTKATDISLPDSISSIPEVIATTKIIEDLYDKLIENGINKEDARYILPNGVVSDIFVTMNARELLHFFSLRTCVRAQEEIRKIAVEMLKLVKPIAPIIFSKAGPSCVFDRCHEKHKCDNIAEIKHYYLNLK